jgi:hypothetical protein
MAGAPSTSGDARIAAVLAQLPRDAVVGGWSAARVHEIGCPSDGLTVFDGSTHWEERRTAVARRTLALGSETSRSAARVVVIADPASRVRFRDDARVMRSVVPADERCTPHGTPVTTVVRTAFDMARLLPFRSAVVGLDRLMHLGLLEPGELERLVDVRRGWVGVGEARKVADVIDAGSESPQESLLRLSWLDCGLPRPSCNVVVRDVTGRFVARVDLIDPQAGVVGEYDGSWHAGAARRSDDARRQEELEGLGLTVLRATSTDMTVQGQRGFQSRLRAAYRRAASASTRSWILTDR